MATDALQAIQAFCGFYPSVKDQINSSVAQFVPVIENLCNAVYQQSSANISVYSMVVMLAPVVVMSGYLTYQKLSSRCQKQPVAQSPA